MKNLTAFGILLLTSCVSTRVYRNAAEHLDHWRTERQMARKILICTEQSIDAALYNHEDPGYFDPLSHKVLLQPKPINTDTNSAAKISWMSEYDREVLYWLNVARLDPPGFFKRFILKEYTANPSNSYLSSLMSTMYGMKPVSALLPDKSLYDAAMCHAKSSGAKGYVGHARNNTACKKIYTGECCSYGSESSLAVVIQLLVDEGVPSLGHRILCLGDGFTLAGIASAPHTRYGTNTVIDFR